MIRAWRNTPSWPPCPACPADPSGVRVSSLGWPPCLACPTYPLGVGVSSPGWPPCPACPDHPSGVGAPSRAGLPAQPVLPIPQVSGVLPGMAPLPSLSCPSLGCRGALLSWHPCPACPAHPSGVGRPPRDGPPAQPVLPIPQVLGSPLELAPLPSLSCTPLG